MAISDREIDILFKPLEVTEAGIELTIENDSGRLDISSLFLVTEGLWRTRVYVLAVSRFAHWLLAPDASDEPNSPAMEAFAKALRQDDFSEIDTALDRLSYDIGLWVFPPDTHYKQIRLEFVAGYHENPTRLAFVALGAIVPMTMMVMIFGVTKLWQEYTAPECVAQASRMTDRRLEMLGALHRRQGQMTPELLAALKSIIDAGDAAARRCGSNLHGIALNVTVPPGFTFDTKLGGPASDFGP